MKDNIRKLAVERELATIQLDLAVEAEINLIEEELFELEACGAVQRMRCVVDCQPSAWPALRYWIKDMDLLSRQPTVARYYYLTSLLAEYENLLED